MLKHKKPNVFSRLLYNQATLAVLGLLIMVVIGYPLAKNISKQYEINNEIKELEKEIAGLEGKNLELKNFIEYLESDQFVDEQARLNLNYKKEGEEVVVVVQNRGQSASSAEEAGGNGSKTIYRINGLDKTTGEKKTGNPAKWWRYFFK